MVTVVLSHDIDRTKKTYQFFTKPIRELLKGRFKGFIRLISTFFRKDNYWTFDDIIQVENSFNVKSTFFFLNESIKFNITKPKTFSLAYGRYNICDPQIINLIKWLDKNGWEIGLHGSYNSYCDINLLKKEKDVLENILGHKILGVRQHHLNRNDKTWEIQNAIGFKYDSSLGSNDTVGFIDNRIAPFNPLNNEFVVFPMVIMDKTFMDHDNSWEELDKIINICEREKAVLVICFHNHVFNEKEFPGYREAYIKIIQKCKEKGAVFKKFEDLMVDI